MEKNYQYFLIEIKDKIARLMINREDKSNALNMEAWEELREIITFLGAERSVRVVVLSGRSQNFSAGMDLSTLMGLPGSWEGKGEAKKRDFIAGFIEKLQTCINALESCPKPVIASVNGACIGGALSIVTACDMVYCSEDAVFSIRETDLGIVADMGALQRLPNTMSPGMVSELAYTARNFDASEAKDCGLVNKVYKDKNELDEEVGKLASMIASKSPLVIKGIKKSLLFTRDHSVQQGLDHIRMWNSAMLISEDLTEAMMAYMQKREPNFKD